MATRYWVGGAGNWSSTTKWSTSSGGASGASVPTSTDDAVFDANSGGKFTATVDTAQTVNSITITPSAAAGVMTISLTAKLTTNNLTTSGTAGNNRIFFTCTTYGIAIDFAINGTVSISDCDFRGIYVTGTAAPISGTRIGNRGECRGITFSTPKTVYWNLAGSQAWTANAWTDTSTGTPSTDYFPLPQDTATFTNAGSAGTITLALYVGNLDLSGRTSAVSIVTAAVPVYGNWTNGSGVVFSGVQPVVFAGGNIHTITSAGKTFSFGITVDSYGGTVQLADALNIGTNTLTVTNGTFDTQNYNVTAGTFSSTNTNVRTINLGSSTYTNINAGASVNFTTTTNLTFNAGTSSIVFTGISHTLSASGLTFYNVSFTATSTTTHNIVGSSNTFNNLTFTAPALAGLMQCTISGNQTINGTLTCAGASPVRRIFLRSDTIGTQRDLTVGTLSATDCDFRDIEILGGAAGTAPTRAGDCGGNAGITFPVAKTVYWNLAGAQNWSATGWCPSSAGTPDINQFPLAQDTAKFDNAGSVTGTITIDAACNIGTFDASARTSAMTLTTSTNAPIVYGDWKFGTGVTSSSTTGAISFIKPGTQTITSNGVQFGCPITINHPSGTVQLADALSLNSARTLTLTAGTFDAVTYNVTTGAYSGSIIGGTVTTKMGSGTWTLSGTGIVWNTSNGSPIVVAGTSTIVLSDTSTIARTFAGGGLYYNKLTIGGTTGTSTLTITGANTFGELASTKTVAHTIILPSSTTTTIGKWSVTGTSGNVVTLAPSTAATTYTIFIAGPANSGIDYLSVSYCAVSTTSPGEFYVGANSTNTAGNTGAIIFTAAPTPRTLYWVGGTGNWSSTTKWSTASGGASGAAIPTSLDAVNFDSASNATAYTATIDAGVTIARCASFTMARPASGNVTFAGTVAIAFHGNVSFSATGITRSYTGAMNLAGNSSYTFTTNGLGLGSLITSVGISATWTLGSSLTTSTVQITYGTFSTSSSNYNLTTNSSAFTSSNSYVRSLLLNGSTVTLSAGITFTNSSNFTFNAGTSSILTAITSQNFDGGGQTFYDVTFTSAAASGNLITGTNTFNSLTITGRTTVGIASYIFSANQTINTLTLNAGSAAAYRTFLRADTIGTTRTLTVTTLTAGATDVDFRDITIAGGAAPISGTRFGDGKGNSGITFPAAKTVYYRSTIGTDWGFTGSGSWSATSGGALDATQFPLAQDTAVFPAATYPGGGATVAINASYNIGTIDMSLRTANTMTLSTGTAAPQIYGNWINGTGSTLSSTGIITFVGRGSQTITSAGKAFSQPIAINSIGGSVTLQDAFTSNAAAGTVTINLLAGTFDANTYNITINTASATGGIATSGTLTRTLALGSGTTTFAGSGSQFTISTTTNLTVTGTGTISFTSASAKTFAGGGVSYSGITLNNGGAGALTVTGNNTFKDITNTYSATGAATISLGATTTTLTQFTGTGASGKVLTLSGTSAASPATLILSSGSVTTPDYLAINNVRAYSLDTTWYAGANSTNGGSLGWYFQAYSPGGAYTITANNGTYTVTGKTATLTRDRVLTSSYGSYTVNGQSVTLVKGRVLTANNGSYAVTGNTVTINRDRALSPDYGTYSVSGQTVTINRDRSLTSDYGSYAVTGNTVTINRDRMLTPVYGTYAVTGQTVTLTRDRALTANNGAYLLVGNTVTIVRSRLLTPDYGVYTLSGQNITITYLQGRTIVASAGAYALTGQTATLIKTRLLLPDYGTYALSGQTVTLTRDRALSPDYGTYALSGQTITLTHDRVIYPDTGSYVVLGNTAQVSRSKLLLPDYGVYAVTGQTATLLRTRSLVANNGSYAIVGQAATVTRDRALSPDYGTYATTGQTATLLRSRVMYPDAGAYAVAGQTAQITRDLTLAAQNGTYTLAGQNVDIVRSGLPVGATQYLIELRSFTDRRRF